MKKLMDNKEIWSSINEKVKKAALKSRRDPKNITIVGVTKKQPVEKIQEFINLGLRSIGATIDNIKYYYIEKPKYRKKLLAKR